jgi:hypothetical protein
MSKTILIPLSLATKYFEAIKISPLQYGKLDVVVIRDEDFDEVFKIIGKEANITDVPIENSEDLLAVLKVNK